MSEALVPAVTRPPAARTGTVAMALPAVIVDAGPVAVERFLEFFAASIVPIVAPRMDLRSLSASTLRS